MSVVDDLLNPEFFPGGRPEMSQNKRKRHVGYLRNWVARVVRGYWCISCGTSENLTWHHRDPKEKRNNVSNINTDKPMWIEVAKCDLVCRECHTKIHQEWDKSKWKELKETW